jgi:hypothetical protein
VNILDTIQLSTYSRWESGKPGSEVQGSKVQGSEVQRFKVQRFKGSEVQRFRGSSVFCHLFSDPPEAEHLKPAKDT